ncbi:MAG: hypothetical protein LBH15_01040 [Treponema sp.]|nr:hypothetical protein [Treponema sp.]
MKFGVVVVLSNAILFAFILLILFLPVVILGPQNAGIFWKGAWPAGVFFLLVLVAMNVFYALNFRLYYLLEREDWPALARYLEKRIIDEGRYHSFGVRLLSNAYLLLSDSEGLANLENKVAAAKPALLEKLALIFGAGRIIRKDYTGAARFFADRLACPNASGGEWLPWYEGFALLLDSQYAAAADRLSGLARDAKDPVVTALSAWILGQALAPALPEQSGDFAILSEQCRKRVRGIFPRRAAWDRKTEAIQDEIHAVLISKYLEDTADWLYKGQGAVNA